MQNTSTTTRELKTVFDAAKLLRTGTRDWRTVVKAEGADGPNVLTLTKRIAKIEKERTGIIANSQCIKDLEFRLNCLISGLIGVEGKGLEAKFMPNFSHDTDYLVFGVVNRETDRYSDALIKQFSELGIYSFKSIAASLHFEFESRPDGLWTCIDTTNNIGILFWDSEALGRNLRQKQSELLLCAQATR